MLGTVGGVLAEETAAAEASVTDMRAATMQKNFIVFKLQNKLSISQTGSVRRSLAHQITSGWYREVVRCCVCDSTTE